MSRAEAGKAEQAADFLMTAWTARRREPALPAGLAPTNEAEAAAICDAILAKNTRPIAGWKIGATAIGAQKALGLAGPFVGFIPEGVIDASGVSHAYADMMRPVIESEYAYRLKADLPARAHAYSEDEVAAAVGSLMIGMEIPESRLGEDHGLGPLATVCDHGGTGRFVCGAEFTDWQAHDVTGQDVVLTFDGKEVGRGTGAPMMGHPFKALVWFVNHMGAKGVGMKAGQFVTTGSATGVIVLKHPAKCVADFGPLGKVEISFT